MSAAQGIETPRVDVIVEYLTSASRGWIFFIYASLLSKFARFSVARLLLALNRPLCFRMCGGRANLIDFTLDAEKEINPFETPDSSAHENRSHAHATKHAAHARARVTAVCVERPARLEVGL